MEIHETDAEQLPVFMPSRGVAPGHAMRNAPSSPQLAIRIPATAGVRSGRGAPLSPAPGVLHPPVPARSVRSAQGSGGSGSRLLPGAVRSCLLLQAAITALARGGRRGPARAATATPARGRRP